jgi:hypothetical protein
VQVSVEPDDEGVTVKLDGQVFTRYLFQSGPKPILWPIIGPTGAEVTRGYPMRPETPEEKADHVHHRSLWFTHGDVNGTSFWHESPGHGAIKHRKLVKAESGPEGTIVTENDWIDADGKVLCRDVVRLGFGASGESRWIDYDITITAADEPVKFGDTKEGTFGVRVAGTMKVTAELGGKIINSAGDTDEQAWGKAASWVDYRGPVVGETVGIAIMNHPTSFRFPTYWHVRTYGLFAANPFGLHNFKNSNDVDGSHTLQPGESMTLRYRVLVHKGDEKVGRVADAYSEYAKLEKNPNQ